MPSGDYDVLANRIINCDKEKEMYLISAYFDDRANKILKRYIERIAASTGNTYMLDHNVPPHLTISSVEARSGEVLIPCVKRLENIIEAGQIQFVSVGMFFPYVMFVAPVLNEYLMDVSTKVYDALRGVPDVSVSRVYRPMQWMPHSTLGKKLDQEQMRKAFAAMQVGFQPFEAAVVKIGLADTNPHRDILSFRVG